MRLSIIVCGEPLSKGRLGTSMLILSLLGKFPLSEVQVIYSYTWFGALNHEILSLYLRTRFLAPNHVYIQTSEKRNLPII